MQLSRALNEADEKHPAHLLVQDRTAPLMPCPDLIHDTGIFCESLKFEGSTSESFNALALLWLQRKRVAAMQVREFKDFNEILTIQNPKRSFMMHKIERPGMIVPVEPHLKIKKKWGCLIENVSCGGALLNVSPYLDIPKNFFLIILGSSEEIGTTQVRREADRMMVRFNMFLDAGFLEAIVKTASLEQTSA